MSKNERPLLHDLYYHMEDGRPVLDDEERGDAK